MMIISSLQFYEICSLHCIDQANDLRGKEDYFDSVDLGLGYVDVT
jgi:hypothetical protein